MNFGSCFQRRLKLNDLRLMLLGVIQDGVSELPARGFKLSKSRAERVDLALGRSQRCGLVDAQEHVVERIDVAIDGEAGGDASRRGVCLCEERGQRVGQVALN